MAQNEEKDEEKEEKVPYTYTPFNPNNSTAYTTAYDAWNNANNAYTTHVNDGFTWDRQNEYDTAYGNYNNWLNNGFSYDFNADALYQQYKDKYIQQGKMAMQNTMGQAAALTGGYGNSYASTVGNQAYQASLQNLNDVIPQLYQMAYDMHNQKGQNMLNQLGLLESDRNYQYGTWVDHGNMLNNDRNYWQSEVDNIYNREYAAHNDNEAMLYQTARDAVTDEQWAAEHALNERQVVLDEDKWAWQKDNTSTGGKDEDEVEDVDEVDEDDVTHPTFSTYSDAAAYIKSNGGNVLGLMTKSEWARRKSSYNTTGQGSAEVKNYSSYNDYLNAYVTYTLSEDGQTARRA